MKTVRLNKQVLKCLPHKKYAEVVFIGDVHWGSPQCDKKRFLDNVNFCLKNNLYVFLMGDLIEMATRDSIGSGVYDQEFIGQTQTEQIIDILTPLAQKGLILGLLNGNHEERVYKSTGINISKLIASALNVRYLGDACWNYFKVGKQIYSIYTLHGRTNARYEGTALTALERLSASFDADLVAMGHTHKLISSHILIQKRKGNQIIYSKKHLLITGSYLMYDGSYAQKGGLNISKLGSPKIQLFKDKHEIVVLTVY